MQWPECLTRRRWLTACGGVGLSLVDALRLRGQAAPAHEAGAVVHRPLLLGRHEPSRNLGPQAGCAGRISRRVQADRHGRSRHPHRRTHAAAGPAHRQAGDHSLDASSLVGARQGDVLEHHRPSAVGAGGGRQPAADSRRTGRASARWCRSSVTRRRAFPTPCSCPIRWSTTTRCKRATTPAFSAQRTTRSSSGPTAAGPGAASRATSAPWCLQPADGDRFARLLARGKARRSARSALRRRRHALATMHFRQHGVRHPLEPDGAGRLQSRPRTAARCATPTATTCAAKACCWPGG